MTDAELEKLARETRVLEEDSHRWEDDVQIILAALKSVRDAAIETEQQLEEYQELCHSLERKIEDVRCICIQHTPKRYDVVEMVKRALKRASAAPPPPPRATGKP